MIEDAKTLKDLRAIDEHIAALEQRVRELEADRDQWRQWHENADVRAQAAEREAAALKHDIERHIAIASEQATEIEGLRAERDALRLRVALADDTIEDMMAHLSNYIAGHYNDPHAEATRDELFAICRDAYSIGEKYEEAVAIIAKEKGDG